MNMSEHVQPMQSSTSTSTSTHSKWPTTPSNSPTHHNDVNIATGDVIIDYLSQFELPSDLDTNQINNNFDSSMDVDVDQDVGDWLDSLMPQTSGSMTGRGTNIKPETILPELNGNFCSSNSDPLLGLHPNSVFLLDDSDMCSNSMWDQWTLQRRQRQRRRSRCRHCRRRDRVQSPAQLLQMKQQKRTKSDQFL